MPAFVSSNSNHKVPNVKLPPQPSFSGLSNIINPFEQLFGEIKARKIFFKQTEQQEFKLPVPGEGLPRVIHYCADQSGCAFWRMVWPGDELLAHNRAVVMTLYQMVLFPQFYLGIDAVKLQRQCTDQQLEFVKFLRNVSDDFKNNPKIGKGFRIIWEIDDIVCPAEDIPDYNVCKDAFLGDKVHTVLKEMMKYVDEMVVVSEKMKQHYQKHLGFDKISVVPNYAPKSWLDRGYSLEDKLSNYKKRKKKPRILYAGSGTHFDVANRVNQFDDFGHVVDVIARDLVGPQKYDWVFLGGLPMKLRQFIGNGIEFHNWSAITEYPQLLESLDANVAIAPLANNNFSRSKANIKLTENGALGVPCVAQNLECYNSDGWKYLFNTGDEMMKQIDSILASEESYKKAVESSRNYAEKFWLKDHLDEHMLIYTTPYGSEERKKNKSFFDNNKNQFN